MTATKNTNTNTNIAPTSQETDFEKSQRAGGVLDELELERHAHSVTRRRSFERAMIDRMQKRSVTAAKMEQENRQRTTKPKSKYRLCVANQIADVAALEQLEAQTQLACVCVCGRRARM
jgi:hypothetical protein